MKKYLVISFLILIFLKGNAQQYSGRYKVTFKDGSTGQ